MEDVDTQRLPCLIMAVVMTRDGWRIDGGLDEGCVGGLDGTVPVAGQLR
jgi:hypothetical protein